MMLFASSSAWPRSCNLRGQASQVFRRSGYRTFDPACKPITQFGGTRVSVHDESTKVSRVTDNFNRIACDLDRALGLWFPAGVESFLMQRAREASWFYRNAEAVPFRLNLAALADLAGKKRPWFSTQFNRMVQRGFFVEVGDGTYLINKDYREWLGADGRRLFTDEQIKWIMEVTKPGLPKTRKTRSAPSGKTNGPDRPEKQTHRPEKQTVRTVPSTVTRRPLDCNAPSGKPDGPDLGHIGTGAELNLREREERERESNTPPNPQGGEGVWVSTDGGEPVPIEDAPKPVLPELDPAELARVQAKAEHLFPMLDFGAKVRGTAASFPLAWIDRALEDMHAKGKSYWPFLVGILRRMEAEGGSSAPAGVGTPRLSASEAKQQALREGFAARAKAREAKDGR